MCVSDLSHVQEPVGEAELMAVLAAPACLAQVTTVSEGPVTLTTTLTVSPLVLSS